MLLQRWRDFSHSELKGKMNEDQQVEVTCYIQATHPQNKWCGHITQFRNYVQAVSARYSVPPKRLYPSSIILNQFALCLWSFLDILDCSFQMTVKTSIKKQYYCGEPVAEGKGGGGNRF